MINILNKGFIEIIDMMGTDLSIVNAARISMGKRKDKFDESDYKLLVYLLKNKHTAPFRHCQLTFHIKAPIFVLRQWMKHRIASEFNEISGRYVEFEPSDYYIPTKMRSQSSSIKQGSGPDLDLMTDGICKLIFVDSCKQSISNYKKLLESGVAKEQARCILPQGMYSEVYWTASLQAVSHFLNLREDSHAQWEIKQYACGIRVFAELLFPETFKALKELENE